MVKLTDKDYRITGQELPDRTMYIVLHSQNYWYMSDLSLTYFVQNLCHGKNIEYPGSSMMR